MYFQSPIIDQAADAELAELMIKHDFLLVNVFLIYLIFLFIFSHFSSFRLMPR